MPLEARRQHWGSEPTQTAAILPGLTPIAQQPDRDLREDTYGPRVRLEQERIRFGAVSWALVAFGHPHG
ncbi:MAG: Wadjet anti-phage system protein JetD domain-containing protein [Angustibacter sp.]